MLLKDQRSGWWAALVVALIVMKYSVFCVSLVWSP